MKKIALTLFIALALTGISFAQLNTILDTPPASEHKNAYLDVADNTLTPGNSGGRYGNLFWSNPPVTGWYPVTTGYTYLDWGLLNPPPSMLFDEVVDGFTFVYGTNNIDPAGEDWIVGFYDSCTGWGNMGVPESMFLFMGLPNGYGLPTLPPGYGWIWQITVDLENSGYEFLLGQRFGQSLSLMSPPTMGTTGWAIGSPGGGTENAVDIYTYAGYWQTISFAPPAWATFARELYGRQDPAQNMTYYGIGAPGNDAALYTIGDWQDLGNVQFMLRRNQMTVPGWLLISLTQRYAYYPPPYDFTLLVGSFAGGSPYAMMQDMIGDFDKLTLTIPPGIGPRRVYFQGALTNINPILPADLSNGVHSN